MPIHWRHEDTVALAVDLYRGRNASSSEEAHGLMTTHRDDNLRSQWTRLHESEQNIRVQQRSGKQYVAENIPVFRLIVEVRAIAPEESQLRMLLKSVKQEDQNRLVFRWDDGHVSPVSTRTLRDRCPCAGCSGETILFQTFVPPKADISAPGRYALRSVSTVGSYALKMVWGDDHDLGIYTWEHLRSLCECDECVKIRQGQHDR
jgi:DUF971 family protein